MVRRYTENTSGDEEEAGAANTEVLNYIAEFLSSTSANQLLSAPSSHSALLAGNHPGGVSSGTVCGSTSPNASAGVASSDKKPKKRNKKSNTHAKSTNKNQNQSPPPIDAHNNTNINNNHNHNATAADCFNVTQQRQRQRQSTDLLLDRETAYNSDDEHVTHPRPDDSLEFQNLAKALRETHGWEIVPVQPDGACLFRAVSHQLFGRESEHDTVRNQVVDYMERNQDHFAQFVVLCSESFEAYLERKRQPDSYGNHLELQAISELYGRPIEIYCPASVDENGGVQPFNVIRPDFELHAHTHAHTATANHRDRQRTISASLPPIRLSYHWNIHYNSIIDPECPEIGVGLGMRDNLQPKRFDEELLNDAQDRSLLTEMDERFLRTHLLQSIDDELEEDIRQHAINQSLIEFEAMRLRDHKEAAKKEEREEREERKEAEAEEEATRAVIANSRVTQSTLSSSLQLQERINNKNDDDVNVAAEQKNK